MKVGGGYPRVSGSSYRCVSVGVRVKAYMCARVSGRVCQCMGLAVDVWI